jgi:pimeloyl-ACP methyl ester carboxylesterase
LICFEAATASADMTPHVTDVVTDSTEGVIHETLQLRASEVPEPVVLHVDFAYPQNVEDPACVLFNPGGRGRSNTEWVLWLARRHGLAAMSYDWPGRHRSPALKIVPNVLDPFQNSEADIRKSYMYTLANAAAKIYRYWLLRAGKATRILGGSSWGGLLTLLLASQFHDHDLAYAEFGAGNFARDVPKRRFWDLWSDSVNPVIVDKWREAFDPISRVSQIRKPIVMATSSNDRFFSLEMFESTFANISAPKTAVIAPNSDHNMRTLNQQFVRLSAAASRRGSSDFTWLARQCAEESFSEGHGFTDHTAWFALTRGRNHTSRLWHSYPVRTEADLRAAEEDFRARHGAVLQEGDTTTSFVTYQRASFGERFMFATYLLERRVMPPERALKPPAWLDLRPVRKNDFEDRVAFRVNVREEPDILRFAKGGESQVTISGVFCPPAFVAKETEIELRIEIVEAVKGLTFCLLRDAETASEAAWGCELPVGGTPGEVMHAVLPVSKMQWMNLVAEEFRNRKLREWSPPSTSFDPAGVTAVGFGVSLASGGAIRVLELAWKQSVHD